MVKTGKATQKQKGKACPLPQYTPDELCKEVNFILSILSGWDKEGWDFYDKTKIFQRIQSVCKGKLDAVSEFLKRDRSADILTEQFYPTQYLEHIRAGNGTKEWVDSLFSNAYQRINGFFKDFCNCLRVDIRGRESVKNMLADIIRNSFLLSIEHPKIYCFEPFTYEAGEAAFDAVLDKYDANKREGYWLGFWSVMGYDTMTPYVDDSADRDIFWDFLRKRPRNEQGLYC